MPGRTPTLAAKGLTPLHLACQSTMNIPGFLDDACVVLLLRAGADPAAVEYQGITPAHFAAVSGSVAAIRALVEAGA